MNLKIAVSILAVGVVLCTADAEEGKAESPTPAPARESSDVPKYKFQPIAVWIDALDDADHATREIAVGALGQLLSFASVRESALDALREGVRNSRFENVRKGAISILSRLNGKGEVVDAAVRDALEDPDVDVRMHAAKLLEYWAPDFTKPDFIVALEPLLMSDDPETAEDAIDWLAVNHSEFDGELLKPLLPRVLEILKRQVKEPNYNISRFVSIAGILTKFPKEAESALPTLREAYRLTKEKNEEGKWSIYDRQVRSLAECVNGIIEANRDAGGQ